MAETEWEKPEERPREARDVVGNEGKLGSDHQPVYDQGNKYREHAKIDAEDGVGCPPFAIYI